MKDIATVQRKNIPFKKFIPGIAWFFVVLILICIPKDDIPEVDGWFSWLNTIHFDKWVHAGIFGILAFLFMRPFVHSDMPVKMKWQYCIWIAVIISIWGMATEVIQLYVPGRNFDFIDWAADSSGALVALLFYKKFLINQSSRQLQ